MISPGLEARFGEQQDGVFEEQETQRVKRPDYEALNGQGLPYIRPARIVGELPTPEARLAALDSATHAIAKRLGITALRRIGFGSPVHVAFGLTRPQARNHAMASLLLTAGDDISLDHCPEYVEPANVD